MSGRSWIAEVEHGADDDADGQRLDPQPRSQEAARRR